MSAIKIHLGSTELAVVQRFADALGVKLEDIAYCALNRLMAEARNPAVSQDILETRAWRGENLPLWADDDRSVHAYEGKRDAHEEERLKF